jgi:hypothetical protein
VETHSTILTPSDLGSPFFLHFSLMATKDELNEMLVVQIRGLDPRLISLAHNALSRLFARGLYDKIDSIETHSFVVFTWRHNPMFNMYFNIGLQESPFAPYYMVSVPFFTHLGFTSPDLDLALDKLKAVIDE